MFTVEARSRCLQRGRRCWGHRRPLCARHFHNSAAKVKWTQNTEENMARRINLLLVRHALSGANLDKSLNYRLRSEEHTSELQSLMRNSYAVFCLKKKKKTHYYTKNTTKRRQRPTKTTQ